MLCFIVPDRKCSRTSSSHNGRADARRVAGVFYGENVDLDTLPWMKCEHKECQVGAIIS